MRIYIGQQGSFWSLSYEQWISLCKDVANGGNYDLTEFKELKNLPNGLIHNGHKGRFSATSKDMMYFEILDWCQDDFQDWLEEYGILENGEDEEEYN